MSDSEHGAKTGKVKVHNWNTLPRESVRQGVERVAFRSNDAMLVMNFVSPDMQVRPHQHDYEQVAICVQGRMRYHVGDEVFEMGPGSMIRVPAHTMHYAEPVGDELVLNLDLFPTVREDYRHLVAYQDEEF
jgi:quercetin dioxygenase-like cupin family protein